MMDADPITCGAVLEPQTDDPLVATDDSMAPLSEGIWAEVNCLLIADE